MGQAGNTLDDDALRRTIRSVMATERAQRNSPNLPNPQRAFGRFHIVRGQAAETVTILKTAFRINNVLAFEEAATVPGTSNGTGAYDGLWVAAPPGGVSLSIGDYVWAIYRAGFTDTGSSSTGTGTLPVGWVMLPRSSSGTGVRMCTGLVTATISAYAPTFAITGIVAFTGDAPSDPLTVVQNFPVGYRAGDLVLAIREDTGDWSNTPDYNRIFASGSDKYPETLFDSIIDHGVFQAGTDIAVKAQALDVGGDNYRVKLFIPLSSGTEPGGTSFTTNKPTSIELNLNGTALEVKLNYEIWTITVLSKVNNGTGVFTDSVPVGTCGT